MPARMARRTSPGSARSNRGEAGALSAGCITGLDSSSRRRVEPRKAAFEIIDQVVDILKPDMDAHAWAGRLPPRAGTQGRWIRGDHEAFVAAPAVAELEQVHVI